MASLKEQNDHLNIFHFYGNNDEQYYENNLTRGLAICLENDAVLLDRFLRNVINKTENKIFPIQEIRINVQKKASQLTNIDKLIGVAMTAEELSEKSPDKSIETGNPVTDLTIQINDTLIVIEVKKNKQDCRAQLINQLERIAKINELPSTEFEPINYSWEDVMALIRNTLKFQKNINSKNRFTDDYYQFIKRKHPAWLGAIKLNEIRFPKNLENDTIESTQKELIEVRLNVLKKKILESWNKEKGLNQELVYERANLPVSEYSWVDEVSIEPETNGNNYIAIKIWPGDTKTQGYSIFNTNRPFEWPKRIEGSDFRVIPYIKFAHRQGLCWINLKDKSNPITHTGDFFYKYTGKWNRDEANPNQWIHQGANWSEFNNILKDITPGGDWKKISGWDDKIQDSNRSFFNISVGFAISVLLKYKQAQKLDGDSTTHHYPLAEKLKTTSEKLLEKVNNQFNGKN